MGAIAKIINGFLSLGNSFMAMFQQNEDKEAGRKEVQLKNTLKALKDVDNSKKNSDKVDGMSIDHVRDELYEDNRDQSL